MKTILTPLIVVWLSVFACGQADGIPPFGAAEKHEIDTINLATLTPVLNFPVISKPGAIPFYYSQTMGQVCNLNGLALKCSDGDRPNAFIAGLLGTTMVAIQTTVQCGTVNYTKYTNWALVTSDGLNVHPIDPTVTTYSNSACGPTGFSNKMTQDGSGYSITSGLSATTITATNGYTYSLLSGSNPTVTDTFGNTVYSVFGIGAYGYGAYTYTDTFGTSSLVSSPSTFSSNAPSYAQYSDTSGNTQRILFNVGNPLTYSLSSSCSRYTVGGTFYPITSVQYPDGTGISNITSLLSGKISSGRPNLLKISR